MPTRTFARYAMEYHRLWQVKKVSLRPMLSSSDAQLCLFASHRARTYAPNFIVEATHTIKNRSSKRHIGANWIAYGCSSLRHTAIGAADNPVEFFWKPSRFFTQPERNNWTTD